jgi:hypothetical protein
MKTIKHVTEALALSLFLAFAAFGLAGCEDRPFEDAGEELDDRIDDAGDALEEAGDEVEDAVDDARN